jgi:hypothetical protein
MVCPSPHTRTAEKSFGRKNTDRDRKKKKRFLPLTTSVMGAHPTKDWLNGKNIDFRNTTA